MIVIVDDFLTQEQCNFLIKFHEDNKSYWSKFLPQWCARCASEETDKNFLNSKISYEVDSKLIFAKKHRPEASEFFKETSQKYLDILGDIETESQKYFGENIVQDWSKLKRNEPHSYHPYHYDSAKTDTILASVTYLNDDYRGGETIMSDGTIIPPKVGRLLIFNGMKYEHGHTMTNSGYRYTIAMWYRKEK